MILHIIIAVLILIETLLTWSLTIIYYKSIDKDSTNYEKTTGVILVLLSLLITVFLAIGVITVIQEI